MSDPLSIIAGIAGIACAGAQLSLSLYEITNRLINAPKEIANVAKELAHLASIFEHLWTTLEKNQKLIKEELIVTTVETLSRFEALQKDVKDIISKCSRFDHLKWLFKRERVASLIAKVDAVKVNLNLLLSIVQIAVTVSTRSKK
jgi:ATP phosphoribosyltransferase regulatory subunit HisZ